MPKRRGVQRVPHLTPAYPNSHSSHISSLSPLPPPYPSHLTCHTSNLSSHQSALKQGDGKITTITGSNPPTVARQS
ncbi:hypothetical protein RRG08_015300 [Elysia crispata]|uniref:Uncharacterized protein n=1 Tax=Elysia crispata TaxID=231223 RepID=A0AAE1DN15_9GAST|nr:hypothetical protein RRG08_015300 [Elysia crispata]